MQRKRDWSVYLYPALTLAVMIAIFLFSSQNADDSSETSTAVLTWIAEHVLHNPQTAVSDEAEHLIRKTAHFTIYLCLGVSTALTARAWRKNLKSVTGGRAVPWKWYLGAFLAAVFYACTDELHQYFTPGRSNELRDVCIDSLGALAGVLSVSAIDWYGNKRRFLSGDGVKK